MPSAEETTYLFEVMPDAGISQDSFAARDVDVLVSRIKQNLRLSSLKSRSSLAAHTMRASPYRLQQRDAQHQQESRATGKRTAAAAAAAAATTTTTTTTTTAAAFNRRCVKAALVRTQLDDSYECFQALLRKGALIKEAVKRLQTNPGEDYEDDDGVPVDEEDDEDEEEEEDDDDDVVVNSHHHHHRHRHRRHQHQHHHHGGNELDEEVDRKRRATSTTLDSMDDDDDEED